MGRPTEPDEPGAGGYRELINLAVPFILSNSFWTVQIFADRVLLSRSDPDAVGASLVAAMLFWTPLTLLQNTAMYATVFVSQYIGAGRPSRVGPVIWQAIWFSLAAGLAFLLLVPVSEPLAGASGHSPELARLEAAYFRCLCYAALPALLVATASAFFGGRGDSWTVLLINATGTLVNVPLAYALINGYWGFPKLDIVGAGWATVVGSWAAAFLAFALLFRKRHRAEFGVLAGWRLDPALMARFLRFGIPNGLMWALEGVAFCAFLVFVGRLGVAEMTATGVAFTINLLAILPTAGVGQAVEVLVGRRLGEDRPDLAEATTWRGFHVGFGCILVAVAAFVFLPGPLVGLFASESQPEKWAPVAALVPVLLRFMAVYSIFDTCNLIFSFALRGAGDVRFVTVAAIGLAWPIMVLPTYLAWQFQLGLMWPWAFVSLYVAAMAGLFFLRFRSGKWKTMRVIEAAPAVVADEAEQVARSA